MMIKCPECGKEISDSATNCPNCGCPVQINEQNNNYQNNQYNYETESKVKKWIVIAVIVILSLIAITFDSGNSSDKSTNDNTENTEQIVDTSTPSNSPSASPSEESKKEENEKSKKNKKTKLSKKEYIKKSKHLYYDDVFFGDKSLKGQLLQLDLFIEEKRKLDIYDYNAQSFVDEYKVNPSFWFCGVKRKDDDSYVGSTINVFVYEKDEKMYDIMNKSDKITVYGEVLKWSKNTWDGYNEIYFVVKYIK